jgi:SAM-dependent MidA family methyltransferase
VSSTAAGLIQAEIERSGPIPFDRFMELALYAPGVGYYTSSRNRFGKEGDFYTASQIQPVFGMVMARLLGPMLRQMESNTVVELGAGRGEMAEAFREFEYIPIEVERGVLPEPLRGIVFANEFFDALPVRVASCNGHGFREMLVTLDRGHFVFRPSEAELEPRIAAYLDRYHPKAREGAIVEVNLRAIDWIARVSHAAERARFVIIDYGYTSAEWKRFEHGTLMSYWHHKAGPNVLEDVGERDITAYVAWTPLEDALKEHGWQISSFETLAKTILPTGEGDQFASMFHGCSTKESLRRRLQLKTLVFGMGEVFRVMMADKGLHK